MAVAKKRHELYEELGSIVGAKYVSDDHGVLLSYTRDVSTMPPAKPQGVVVRPSSVEEVVQLVRLANQTCTPLIPMGGKASISGVPPGQPGRGIIVDMKRMDKVIEIDEVNMTATAQAGITWGELAGKVNAMGFDVHTAGTPHYADTIGGHISGEPGAGFGGYGFSVGWNWHYLLGMKVVLPNGSVVDTGTGEGSLNSYRGNTFARAMHGPDMTGMFTGDGGIFGIKVEATYRMFHLPKFRKGGVRCWDSLDEAYKAYYELWEVDPFLYMQPYANGMLLSPEFVRILAPGNEPAWVLFWFSIGNSEEEVELKHKTTDAVCARHGGKVPDGELFAFFTQADHFTSFTHEMSKWATMGMFPLFELIVSRRDILETLKWSREYLFDSLKERGIDPTRLPIISGLLSAGTGNGMTTTEPFVDQSDKEFNNVVHEIWLEFLEQARRRGYVVEATQGHESRLLAKSWTPEFYNYVLSLKKFLDPNNIMNPGVFFA
ncbi:FAD-binding oxidoreductase [Chloroflexota bacterium]